MVAKRSSDFLPAGWTLQYTEQKNGRKARCYTNLETGQKFYSKNKFMRYITTASVHFKTPKCDTPESFIRSTSRRSGSKQLQPDIETTEIPEWLPDGWIVESKTKKSGSQMGNKYKCYIDPLTGHKFYSKPAVSRYLETVNRNVFTSNQKRICTDMHSSSNPPSAVKRQKLTNSAARRQLFAGIESSDRTILALPEPEGLSENGMEHISRKARIGSIKSEKKRELHLPCRFSKRLAGVEPDLPSNSEYSERAFQVVSGKSSESEAILVATGSKEIQSEGVFDLNMHVSTHSTDVLHKKKLLEKGIEDHSNRMLHIDAINPEKKEEIRVSCRSSKRLAGHEPEPVSNLGPSERALRVAFKESGGSEAVHGARISKRKLGKMVSAEHMHVSSPATDIPQGKDFLENGMKKHNRRKTRFGVIKSKKEKKFHLPYLSTKGLPGLEPKLMANSGSSGRALQVASRKCAKSETIPALGLALDTAAHSASQQPEAKPETVDAYTGSRGMKAPLDEELKYKSKKPLLIQAAPAEHLADFEEKNEKKLASQLFFSPDGLPPGWILEIKIRKNAKGIRKDPYYKDPVNGRVFRSRKEVFRYLETGEIRRHAFLPNKRLINNVNLINNDISPPSAAERKELSHRAATGRPRGRPRKQPLTGNESSDMISLVQRKQLTHRAPRGRPRKHLPTGNESSDMISLVQRKQLTHCAPRGRPRKHLPTDNGSSDMISLPLPEAMGLKEKLGKIISAKTRDTMAPTAEILQENHQPISATIKCAETVGNSDPSSSVLPKSKAKPRKRSRPVSTPIDANAIVKYVETGGNSNPRSSALPKVKAKPRKRVISLGKLVSTPAADILKEKKFLEDGMQKHSNGDYQIGEAKSEKKELQFPCQSSEQLPDFEFELVANSGSSEMAFQVDPRNSGENETIPVLSLASDSAVHRESHRLEVEPDTDVAQYALGPMEEVSLDGEASNESQKSLEDQADLKEQPELVAKSGSSDGTSQVEPRNSSEKETIPVLGLAMDTAIYEESQQLEVEPETDLAHNSSRCIEATLDEVPSIKRKKPLEDQAVPEEQPGEMEPELNKSENKDRVGFEELPVMMELEQNKSKNEDRVAFEEQRVMMEPELNKSKNEDRVAPEEQPGIMEPELNKSKNEDRVAPKEQPRIMEPELNKSKNEDRVALKDQPRIMEPELNKSKNEDRVDPEEPGIVEPELNKSKNEYRAAPEEQLGIMEPELNKSQNEGHVALEEAEKMEPEKKDEKNEEPQVVFPVEEFWSDPCLEFAFKTLTGEIPVEDNLEIQDYFEQPPHNSLMDRDGDLGLPDLGLHSFSQCEILQPFDAPEKPNLSLTENPFFSTSGFVPQLPKPSSEGNGIMRGASTSSTPRSEISFQFETLEKPDSEDLPFPLGFGPQQPSLEENKGIEWSRSDMLRSGISFLPPGNSSFGS